MSIENERKYIIDLHRDDADEICRDYNGEWQIVQQSYINDGRVRKIQRYKSAPQYMFTWKARRPDGSSIEIETDISERDFKELWGMATNTILKHRIKIDGYGVKWDIDFLERYDIMKENRGYHYLTIAEVEMPDGWSEPNILPAFVEDNLLFLVTREEDKQWTNKNLSDPIRVKNMLDEALKNKELDRG